MVIETYSQWHIEVAKYIYSIGFENSCYSWVDTLFSEVDYCRELTGKVLFWAAVFSSDWYLALPSEGIMKSVLAFLF